jgi:tRNA-dihydrouridine synthase
MRYYFAPMEGITDSIYRRLHHEYFGGVDRYYMPFLSPTMHRCLTHKEERELPIATSVPFTAVPQVLTKVAGDFLWAAQVIADRGYEEINLNLGCPSGTVVSKGKGSGMLRDLSALDAFLDEIFAVSPLPISIKTRVGMESPEEFPAILEIYNRYPIRELTVHPRVRKQFYDGSVHMDLFRYACENTSIPLCYNGNLCTKAQIQQFSQDFPTVSAIMLGRGLIGDPGMLTPGGTDAKTLEAFLGELFQEYSIAFGGSRNAMFRLKENWRFLFCLFQPDPKLQKRLRKATDLSEYKAVTTEILHNLPLKKELSPDW